MSRPRAAGGVCAVVLTYDRAALLRECLTALGAQSRPPDHILVVDNAGSDGTPGMLAREFPQAEVLVLERNIGAAGGFHAGMLAARAGGFDQLWLMDDDAYPLPDCLEKLLPLTTAADVVVPYQRNQLGQLYGAGLWQGRQIELPPAAAPSPREIDLFAFIGPLVAVRVIDRIGLPAADFFIDYFDWEYALRARQAGFRLVLVPDAIVAHDFGHRPLVRKLGRWQSVRISQPAWKSYYDTRNHLRTLLLRSRTPGSFAWYALVHLRRLAGDLVYEPDRWERARLRLLGVIDGLHGRMGRRHDLSATAATKPRPQMPPAPDDGGLRPPAS